MAKSGAAQCFELILIACRLLAGHGVPLHTLMLITITKRMYLANDYIVFKVQSRSRHKTLNRVKGFCPLTFQRTEMFDLSTKEENIYKTRPHLTKDR